MAQPTSANSPDEYDLASPLDNPSPTVSTPTSPLNLSEAPFPAMNSAPSAPSNPPPRSFAASVAARGGAAMNPDIAARMKAFSISRSTQLSGSPATPLAPSPGPTVSGFPSNFKLPAGVTRPSPQPHNSASAIVSARAAGGGQSLAQKRGIKLPGGLPGSPLPPTLTAPPKRPKPGMTLSQMGGGQANGDATGDSQPAPPQSQMDKYAEYIDAKTGALRFKGKAVVHGAGIDFNSGKSFSISLDEVDTLDEMGKGNYGTVYKVRHARPRFRRHGLGLAGNKSRGSSMDDNPVPPSPTRPISPEVTSTPTSATVAQVQGRSGPTGMVMAMKEMRLELEDAKFQSIIMELDILHRCISSYIVEFYGAFFQEGAVYICMEFMNGGSVDKLYGDGVPEEILQKITHATARGLKYLKEEHNIIHRDVKPTNILMDTRGQIKICDFGVSGNLVASIAKTNIGCQSYMAPERISSGGMAQAGGPGAGTYSVQSDIWSLGLSIIECALGRYPYPPETYDNIFSQLSAIVDGEPPDLPADKYSNAARDFVAGCLNKIPIRRPTYPMLLQHPWLAPLDKPHTISEEDEDAEDEPHAPATNGTTAEEPSPPPGCDGRDFFDREVGMWVLDAIDRRNRGKMSKSAKPALHTVPLDAVSSPVDTKPPIGVFAV